MNGSTYYLDKSDIPYKKQSEVSVVNEKDMQRVDGPPLLSFVEYKDQGLECQ